MRRTTDTDFQPYLCSTSEVTIQFLDLRPMTAQPKTLTLKSGRPKILKSFWLQNLSRKSLMQGRWNEVLPTNHFGVEELMSPLLNQ